MSKQAATPAQPFTLADLQRVCGEAGAPIVQDTDYARAVVLGVQILRNNKAHLASPEWKKARANALAVKKAWSLIARTVGRTRAHYETYLRTDPSWPEPFRGRVVAQAEALATLQDAMAKAKPSVVPGEPRGRGKRGPAALPPKSDLAMIADYLREAFVEAGHPNVSEAAIHCVLQKVFGAATPDTIRKALPPNPRRKQREAHHRMVAEWLGMPPLNSANPADLPQRPERNRPPTASSDRGRPVTLLGKSPHAPR